MMLNEFVESAEDIIIEDEVDEIEAAMDYIIHDDDYNDIDALADIDNDYDDEDFDEYTDEDFENDDFKDLEEDDLEDEYIDYYLKEE